MNSTRPSLFEIDFKAYFQKLIKENRIAELLDFENRQKVFEDVDSRFKFSIVLATGESTPQQQIRCGFFLHDLNDLNDTQRAFTLSPDDFKLFNPNTLTCPIFRRRRDAELTRKIYQNVPVLIKDARWADENQQVSVNTWGVSFKQGLFNMTSDSALFKTKFDLEKDGFFQDAADVGEIYTKGTTKYLPLYEGKMVQMYDHRAGNIVVNPDNLFRAAQQEASTLAEHQSLDFTPRSQYWVDRRRVVASVSRTPGDLRSAYLANDEKSIRKAVMFWLAGWNLNQGAAKVSAEAMSKTFPGLEGPSAGWSGMLAGVEGLKAQEEEKECPLLDSDRLIIQDYSARADIVGMAEALASIKCPQYLLGFKDVTAPTNVRTFIASFIPLRGAGHPLPLVFVEPKFQHLLPCLLANFNSFPLDYVARQKIGGQHLTYFNIEQFPMLPPERYAETWHGVVLSDFIRERVLELCYTAHDLQGFAEELGHTGPPFAWDEERRLHLRCQLDALYFHLYGLTREETVEVLDTFPIVRRQDEAKYGGEYRTRDLIVAYYNAYANGNMGTTVKG